RKWGGAGLTIVKGDTNPVLLDRGVARLMSAAQRTWVLGHKLGHVFTAPDMINDYSSHLQFFLPLETAAWRAKTKKAFRDAFGLLMLRLLMPNASFTEIERLPEVWEEYDRGYPRFNWPDDPHRPTPERISRLKELNELSLGQLAERLGLKLRTSHQPL